MKTLKKSPSIASFISLALVFLCIGVPTVRLSKVHAQSGHRSAQAQRLEREDDSLDISRYLSPDQARVSPDLRGQLDRPSTSGDYLSQSDRSQVNGAEGAGLPNPRSED